MHAVRISTSKGKKTNQTTIFQIKPEPSLSEQWGSFIQGRVLCLIKKYVIKLEAAENHTIESMQCSPIIITMCFYHYTIKNPIPILYISHPFYFRLYKLSPSLSAVKVQEIPMFQIIFHLTQLCLGEFKTKPSKTIFW